MQTIDDSYPIVVLPTSLRTSRVVGYNGHHGEYYVGL